MVARITKYLNKYVRRGICVQPAILTYPTMVFYFWLPPQVLWNGLRGIVIKQRHWQTFWGIIHVDQATLRTKKIYLYFHPLPFPMAARITKYLNKYVRRGICLIYMSSFYFWSPSFARKIRKTNMRYFWLPPQVLWNGLRGIVIKQRHWQPFWGIIHVDQATLRTGSCLLRS
jgi:hypothetical protein